MHQTQVSSDSIERTLQYLQEAGRRGTECVVLWFGRQGGAVVHVQQVYRPIQMAWTDMFRIPPDSMKAVLSELNSKRMMIAAQVHSHPFEAFHSKADDTWAIVRHAGALSLVVPDFAIKTSSVNFMDDAKLFRLTPENRWREVPNGEIEQWLVIC
ncbi:MAG: hypothetical protein OXC18_00870 [Desulfurellaceae bacterium]|nr:hypothetical protein [Desulfurellaceae bacterium]